MASNKVPSHIAIVMDGNGRWASKRFLPRIAGHRQGIETLKKMVSACAHRGINVLTVFAFSSENWNRPAEEVSGLMDILALALSREVPHLLNEGIRLYFVGSRQGLSERVIRGLAEAEAATAHNSKLILNVCFNYGGRWDICQAVGKLVKSGQDVTEELLNQYLALSHCSDPDLLIRTGGEMRLSNFLLWQVAYSELFFSDRLWPEFDEAALDGALAWFSLRERRFGKTSEQLISTTGVGA
jgi:undecaprenyl diphosphate synthase